jgi:sugar phosphate isomerase/epimerase
MKLKQIAAQSYTVREYLKTTPNIRMSMKKIREIGYEAVQLSGMGPVGPEELSEILEDSGLYCCVTHEPGDMILNEPKKVIEKLNVLNCPYTAYPHPSRTPLNTLEEVQNFAARLNRAGRIFHDAGITLAYHNHHLEFRRIGDKTILDIIYEETNPLYLQGEIDTYWVQYGGGNPEAWCRKLKGRLPLLHLKDYAINAENAITFAEVGYGNLDWKAIIRAAEESGCLWFIVEQDECSGDPFDSLRKSYDYIREKLVCI